MKIRIVIDVIVDQDDNRKSSEFISELNFTIKNPDGPIDDVIPTIFKHIDKDIIQKLDPNWLEVPQF